MQACRTMFPVVMATDCFNDVKIILTDGHEKGEGAKEMTSLEEVEEIIRSNLKNVNVAVAAAGEGSSQNNDDDDVDLIDIMQASKKAATEKCSLSELVDILECDEATRSAVKICCKAAADSTTTTEADEKTGAERAHPAGHSATASPDLRGKSSASAKMSTAFLTSSELLEDITSVINADTTFSESEKQVAEGEDVCTKSGGLTSSSLVMRCPQVDVSISRSAQKHQRATQSPNNSKSHKESLGKQTPCEIPTCDIAQSRDETPDISAKGQNSVASKTLSWASVLSPANLQEELSEAESPLILEGRDLTVLSLSEDVAVDGEDGGNADADEMCPVEYDEMNLLNSFEELQLQQGCNSLVAHSPGQRGRPKIQKVQRPTVPPRIEPKTQLQQSQVVQPPFPTTIIQQPRPPVPAVTPVHKAAPGVITQRFPVLMHGDPTSSAPIFLRVCQSESYSSPSSQASDSIMSHDGARAGKEQSHDRTQTISRSSTQSDQSSHARNECSAPPEECEQGRGMVQTPDEHSSLQTDGPPRSKYLIGSEREEYLKSQKNSQVAAMSRSQHQHHHPYSSQPYTQGITSVSNAALSSNARSFISSVNEAHMTLQHPDTGSNVRLGMNQSQGNTSHFVNVPGRALGAQGPLPGSFQERTRTTQTGITNNPSSSLQYPNVTVEQTSIQHNIQPNTGFFQTSVNQNALQNQDTVLSQADTRRMSHVKSARWNFVMQALAQQNMQLANQAMPQQSTINELCSPWHFSGIDAFPYSGRNSTQPSPPFQRRQQHGHLAWSEKAGVMVTEKLKPNVIGASSSQSSSSRPNGLPNIPVPVESGRNRVESWIMQNYEIFRQMQDSGIFDGNQFSSVEIPAVVAKSAKDAVRQENGVDNVPAYDILGLTGEKVLVVPDQPAQKSKPGRRTGSQNGVTKAKLKEPGRRAVNSASDMPTSALFSEKGNSKQPQVDESQVRSQVGAPKPSGKGLYAARVHQQPFTNRSQMNSASDVSMPSVSSQNSDRTDSRVALNHHHPKIVPQPSVVMTPLSSKPQPFFEFESCAEIEGAYSGMVPLQQHQQHLATTTQNQLSVCHAGRDLANPGIQIEEADQVINQTLQELKYQSLENKLQGISSLDSSHLPSELFPSKDSEMLSAPSSDICFGIMQDKENLHKPASLELKQQMPAGTGGGVGKPSTIEAHNYLTLSDIESLEKKKSQAGSFDNYLRHKNSEGLNVLSCVPQNNCRVDTKDIIQCNFVECVGEEHSFPKQRDFQCLSHPKTDDRNRATKRRSGDHHLQTPQQVTQGILPNMFHSATGNVCVLPPAASDPRKPADARRKEDLIGQALDSEDLGGVMTQVEAACIQGTSRIMPPATSQNLILGGTSVKCTSFLNTSSSYPAGYATGQSSKNDPILELTNFQNHSASHDFALFENVLLQELNWDNCGPIVTRGINSSSTQMQHPDMTSVSYSVGAAIPAIPLLPSLSAASTSSTSGVQFKKPHCAVPYPMQAGAINASAYTESQSLYHFTSTGGGSDVSMQDDNSLPVNSIMDDNVKTSQLQRENDMLGITEIASLHGLEVSSLPESLQNMTPAEFDEFIQQQKQLEQYLKQRQQLQQQRPHYYHQPHLQAVSPQNQVLMHVNDGYGHQGHHTSGQISYHHVQKAPAFQSPNMHHNPQAADIIPSSSLASFQAVQQMGNGSIPSSSHPHLNLSSHQALVRGGPHADQNSFGNSQLPTTRLSQSFLFPDALLSFEPFDTEEDMLCLTPRGPSSLGPSSRLTKSPQEGPQEGVKKVVSISSPQGQNNVVQIDLSHSSDGKKEGDSDVSVMTGSMSSGCDFLSFQPDSDGETSLHILSSVPREQREKLSSIPGFSSALNLQNKNGETALFVAVKERNVEVVRFLLTHGADTTIKCLSSAKGLRTERVQHTVLHEAVEMGSLEIVKVLLASPKTDVDFRILSSGLTPLMLALQVHSRKPCKDIIMELIKHKASLTAQDYLQGKTPLMYAIQSRDVSIVENILSEVGVEKARNLVTATAKKGMTCLHFAAELRLESVQKQKLLRCIIIAGGDPSMKNFDGEAARDWAKKDVTDVLQNLKI